MQYKHIGVIAQPTYLVNNGRVFDVTYNIDNADCAKCSIAGTGLTRGGIHSRLGPGCQGILVPACARAAISS